MPKDANITWRSIADDPPPPGETVLVFIPTAPGYPMQSVMIEAWFRKSTFKSSYDAWVSYAIERGFSPTHWVPRLDPPPSVTKP